MRAGSATGRQKTDKVPCPSPAQYSLDRNIYILKKVGRAFGLPPIKSGPKLWHADYKRLAYMGAKTARRDRGANGDAMATNRALLVSRLQASRSLVPMGWNKNTFSSLRQSPTTTVTDFSLLLAGQTLITVSENGSQS